MKTIKPISSVLFLLLMVVTMSNTYLPANKQLLTAPRDTAPGDAYSFQHGESITYKIYYNWNFVWLSAGEVTFNVFDEGSQYHYQAKGRTYSSYEWFFKANDDYNSWVDKNTLLPNYSERNVNEGDYHLFEKISFNQASKKATVWRAHERGKPETKTVHSVDGQVYDILSTLYYLRNIDLANKESGSAVPFRIFMDKEEYPLKMRYLGKEGNMKVHSMGRYNTLKFQPEVIAGNVFSADAKMTVWVSDDQNKIPLLIESPVSVGSVKMVLKSYKGLKYDFKAKAN
ncbi:MAG: DUF3108 domain-containing protein [Lewinellaceae bacterium]|nr:DUF3108 domain-containing protein [Lewinellaceae bacterium]